MIVITNKGIWHGGKSQIVLDLRFNRIGVFLEGEAKYPANAYFDKMFKKSEEELEKEIGKLEKEVFEKRSLAFLGEQGGYVATDTWEIVNQQGYSFDQTLEEKVSEVIVREISSLTGIGEKKIKSAVGVLSSSEEGKTSIAILVAKNTIKSRELSSTLKYLLKAAYNSGKDFIHLCGGKKENEKNFLSRSPLFKFEILDEEETSVSRGYLKYRISKLEEKDLGFVPGVSILISFLNLPQSALSFYPYVLYLSFGGNSNLYSLDSLREAREEIEEKSVELSKKGRGEMKLADEDVPSRGRMVVYFNKNTLEVQMGYIEFEAKTDDGSRAWVVSNNLGNYSSQTLVEESDLIPIPEGVEVQESLTRMLFRDIPLLDVEEDGEFIETSSYVNKEVPKVLWELGKSLKLSWAKITCIAAPFSIEGEDANGYHFYFRERGGHASLSLVTRPGISISTAIDKNIPMVVVEYEEDFTVGSNHEETVKVISSLYSRARKILEKMYT